MSITNEDIITQLLTLGVGTRDEITHAIKHVLNKNDINEVVNYIMDNDDKTV